MPRAHSHARDPLVPRSGSRDDARGHCRRCRLVQRVRAWSGFEPSPSAGLSARWPDRVADVVRARRGPWLLMRDAGHPVREVGNPPELWLAALPLYAELQRAECAFAADHVDRLGAPDLLLVRSADRSSDLVERELAVEEDAQTRLAGHLPDVERLCADLATSGVPESIRHDGLHMSNLYLAGSRLRVCATHSTSACESAPWPRRCFSASAGRAPRICPSQPRPGPRMGTASCARGATAVARNGEPVLGCAIRSMAVGGA